MSMTLEQALADMHAILGGTRYAECAAFQADVLDLAERLSKAHSTGGAAFILGAHRYGPIGFGQNLELYWKEHARPEPTPPATFTIDTLLKYADALCDGVMMRAVLYPENERHMRHAAQLVVEEPDQEELGIGHGPNAGVALVRAFVDMVRRYALVYGDGTLELRDIKLADESEVTPDDAP